MLRFALRTAAATGCAYLLLLAALYFNQDALLFPGARSQGRAEARFGLPAGAELVTLRTAPGDTLAALFGPALRPDGKALPAAVPRPTVVLFYGNGTWLKGAVSTFQVLRKLGCDVLTPEYVGYGLSTGRPGETGCCETADAAYRYLIEEKRVSAPSIVPFGYSLGGAVAVDLAARKPVGGLVALNTFTSMEEMVSRLYPYAPTFLLRHPFRSREKMARVSCPVFLASGTADSLIPPEMSERLARAAAGPVTRLSVTDAEHSNLLGVADPGFYRKLTSFLAQRKPRR